MASLRYDVDKFDGKTNFELWKVKMISLLAQQGLEDTIKEEKEDLKGEQKEQREKLVNKAKGAIFLCLGDKVLREVAKEPTAYKVWKKLEGLYMTQSLPNRLHLKQKLYTFKFTDEKGILDQLDDFNKALDDLENVGVKIEDEDKAVILLGSLPNSYKPLRDAMVYGRQSTITFEEVQSAIKTKESEKLSDVTQVSSAASLLVRKGVLKSKFKKPPVEEKFNGGKTWKGEAMKESRSCHFCKRTGHLKKDCFFFKKKQSEGSNGVNMVESTQEIPKNEMLNVADDSIENQWIMDSGCTFHMCPDRSWFSELKLEDLGSVMLGNNESCKVMGIGSVVLKVHDGSLKTLVDVRYIPSLKRNLISLGTLEEKGFSIHLQKGGLSVNMGKRTVLKGSRKNSLYYLQAETIIGGSETVREDDSLLWHLRLGHLSGKGLKKLQKLGVLKSNGKLDLQECQECILGKSMKLPYPKG